MRPVIFLGGPEHGQERWIAGGANVIRFPVAPELKYVDWSPNAPAYPPPELEEYSYRLVRFDPRSYLHARLDFNRYWFGVDASDDGNTDFYPMAVRELEVRDQKLVKVDGLSRTTIIKHNDLFSILADQLEERGEERFSKFIREVSSGNLGGVGLGS